MDDFHARFSCTGRNYRYIILNRSAKPALDKNRVWWIPQKLDINAMKSAAEKLTGNHDFTSFRASECQAKSPIKTLDSIKVIMDGEFIVIDFSARSFLHHQVRNMVGTLVEIGFGKSLNIDEIFAAKNRSAAGPTAPAAGLYFVSANYATND
jgi:tRNA pseudouridine38-40 synthase